MPEWESLDELKKFIESVPDEEPFPPEAPKAGAADPGAPPPKKIKAPSKGNGRERVKHGERHPVLTKYAYDLRDRGFDPQATIAALRAFYEHDMVHVKSDGTPDDPAEVQEHIEKTVRSVYMGVERRPYWKPPAGWGADPVPPGVPLFQSLAKLLEYPRLPVWLVKKLIETPGTILIFGPSGAGKSYVAVDLAGSISTGKPWAGRDVKATGPVYYFVGEGRLGTLRRFQAWQQRHGVKIPEDKLFLSSTRLELTEASVKRIIAEIEEQAKQSGEPALIIIDTLARTLPSGANENSPEDMGAFINNVDRIRDRFNCVVIILHHTGHQEKERHRGHTSLKAAMDAELRIFETMGRRISEWTKFKDLPNDPQKQEFVLEDEVIGFDEEEGAVSAGVVVWKGVATIETSRGPSRMEQIGLDTLRAAIEKNGGMPVTIEEWRPLFYENHTGDGTEAKRKSFSRIRESLVARKLIRIHNDRYSI